MDKERIKAILNELIDSAEEVQDFNISADVEEINKSTLQQERIERRPTGITNICITTYSRVN